MGIGFSIFRLAAGAVLAFAVDATVAGIDLSLIGWILIAAGALGLVLTMVLLTPRRRRTVTETPRVVAAPAVEAQPPVTPTIATQREVRDERI